MCFLTVTSEGVRPKTVNWPEVLWSNPRIILIVVLLPEPLGPSSPKISPGLISKSM